MPAPLTPRNLLLSLLALCLVAAVLGSDPLRGWATGLGELPGAATARQVTEGWNAALQRVGVAQGYTRLRAQARAFEALRFSFARDNDD